jgi:Glycosyl hydrolase 108
MEKRIRDIISKTIHLEGGYVNDPNDSGGETNHGISKRAFPRLDVKSLSFEDAIQIGYDHYWTPNNLSSYTNDGYVWKCFDIIFNCGVQGFEIVESVIQPDWLDTDAGVDDLITSLDIHYEEIVNLIPKDKKFLGGWETRAKTKYTKGESYTS